jgi:hypothetical protein
LISIRFLSLDRNSCFTAIRGKFCYATTNARIIVDFKVNKARMGTEVEDNRDGNLVEAEVNGTDIIDVVEIIKNGQVIYSHKCNCEDVSFTYTDRDTTGGDSYYYLKVKQENGDIAWASPVFIKRQVSGMGWHPGGMR